MHYYVQVQVVQGSGTLLVLFQGYTYSSKVKALAKSFNSLESFQTVSMSSTYLTYSFNEGWKGNFWFSMSLNSISASGPTMGLPIATLTLCWYIFSLYLKYEL